MIKPSIAIIDFLCSLHGFWRTDKGSALELATGSVIEADDSFPDGAMLRVVYQTGVGHLVNMNKLMDVYLLRHAKAMSETEEDAGTVREQYETIIEHFSKKTGFDT